MSILNRKRVGGVRPSRENRELSNSEGKSGYERELHAFDMVYEFLAARFRDAEYGQPVAKIVIEFESAGMGGSMIGQKDQCHTDTGHGPAQMRR